MFIKIAGNNAQLEMGVSDACLVVRFVALPAGTAERIPQTPSCFGMHGNEIEPTNIIASAKRSLRSPETDDLDQQIAVQLHPTKGGNDIGVVD